MSIVSKMLWVLESRSREPLSLDELAAVTGRSKTYLSRIFPLVTGYSVTAYLRARRLSQAARQLTEGAPDILSVALEAGYGSHEAFTRAFRDQFGITPQTIRRMRNLNGITLVEPLRMDISAPVSIKPPRFENRPEMIFAGIAERHPMNNPAGLPAQWQRFQPYIGNIDGAIAGVAYGLVGEIADNRFEYVVAVEMRAGADIPADLERIPIPALKWARFAHSGDLSTIRQSIGAAEQWLSENGHEPNDASYSFLEYYGPAFDARTGSGDIEIWFGLKD